ncbi:hypothetical protein ABIC83_002406 [Roseateles asaccharophilus]|uniref:hypothetical protein n=1 Tax=Roseateles asaccharophilus TaxID=582607 RepID=UPI0038383536
MAIATSLSSPCSFQLRFAPIPGAPVHGNGPSFPCDARGKVDMDSMSPGSLAAYLAARALIGYRFQKPTVARAN